MTAVLAAVLATLVAVVGWIVNQAFARRALRRNMRIEYLLSAYRRLESISNRTMSTAHAVELETAISDIQLLGSARQVEMASQFAQDFASDHRADSGPLLDDLRASLRHELLLEQVVSRRVVLRVDRGTEVVGPTATTGSYAVWHERVVASLFGPKVLVGDAPTTETMPTSVVAQEMQDLIERSPQAAVGLAHEQLGRQLIAILSDSNPEDVPTGNASELAVAAHQRNLISDRSRDAVEGLGVMYMLALLDDSHRLDKKEAREYVTLATATAYAMRQDAIGYEKSG